MLFHFVVATRQSLEQFTQQSPLAQSLQRISTIAPITLDVFYENNRPLPEIYNHVIETAGMDDLLIFIHDDVWVDDWLLLFRLEEALQHFDCIGIAGNTRRLPQQASWIFKDTSRTFDHGYLSGMICHGTLKQAIHVSFYGSSPAAVKLLDGVFLVAKTSTLRNACVRFDPQFSFHFYDMDFCRSCEQAGLRMGTWPIALTHASSGSYANPEWEQAYALYLQKWGA
jgi:hypothetical protein